MATFSHSNTTLTARVAEVETADAQLRQNMTTLQQDRTRLEAVRPPA